MAAEMPVKDVLCEAMDYLSKLGSNLRTRSENLKEKKIRRDKLTNSLAVQKAADKVLLICELSKKSLANVETGVRKLLEHIDISQASSSIGGKSSYSKTVSKQRDAISKYYYFDYRSRKLKIKHNISLKHYKSVKVLARKMSFSMISKYPVYHDCKLYRIRKKAMEENFSQELQTSIMKNDDPETSTSNEKEESENSKKNSNTEKLKSTLNNISSQITDREDDSNDNVNIIIENESGIDINKENDNNPDTSKNAERLRRNSLSDRKCHKKKSPPKKKSQLKIYSDDDSGDNINSGNEQSSGNISDEKMNKFSEEPACKKRKICTTESKQQNNVVSVESETDNNNPSDGKIGVNDTSKNKSGSGNESVKPMIKCVSLSKLLKPDVLQNNKPATLVPQPSESNIAERNEFNVSKKNEMLRLAKKNKDDFWARKRKEVQAFKPKEFIINIVRLPKLSTNFLQKYQLKRVTRAGDTVCEIATDSDFQQSKDTNIMHRKNSTQLKDSAVSNDMEQITSKVYKAKNSLIESDSDTDANSNNKKESETTVDKIKKSLLISDSDENENDTHASKPKENKTENSIDNGCDKNRVSDGSIDDTESRTKYNTEKSGTNHDTISDTEAAKNDLLQKSDSDSTCEKSVKNCQNIEQINSVNVNDNDPQESPREQKTPEKDAAGNKGDNAKKSLLDDSSDDLNETPLNQRKTTPQSKKKRIRESVQAKNALLRYSSGSETEDEQLRNVLTDIKKSLLEGISDDENQLNVKKLNEGRSSQSSSPDHILEKVTNSYDSDSSKSNEGIRKQKKHYRKAHNHNFSEDDKSTSSSRKMVRSKAKPGNSSGHSSEAQDPNDKDIDGLANLRTLNKSRRRNSDESDVTQSSNSTATRTAAKPTGMISEEILNAESSSDEENSNDENETVDDDLPPVTMTGFNGGLEHLVKEDLLGESDSSVSNKEENKEDSDEEEGLNAKRRKANAIASSDSETSMRKKEKDETGKLSDSDSDDSEVTKRTKRKKKGSDSDASVGSSEDAGKKKRRRIKSIRDSDASGSDSENEGKNKHGRKNIRRVMGKNQLEEATKKAAREERERVARIAERQKMYNNLQFDESGRPDEVVLDKVVLDFDPETKEPLIAVDRGLVKKLKPHQANGIKFMWDACFESVKRIKKDKGSGCILAHCMGLGKTLQVVSLTHTLLSHSSMTKVDRVLVVCPLSTVLNWVNEYKMWLKYAEHDKDIDVYELSRFKQNSERAFQLSQWYEHGGVCVLGYEMFRNLSADNNKKFKKKMLKNFQEALVDPGPDLVVCDEGHLLKNEKTSLSQSMNKVKTLRRIVLTGTPLQNNLKEYYCMVQFVKPNLLGKYNEYLNRFVNPITNGQYTDSTEYDIKIMKRRSHVLHKMLDGAVQRRDYGVLAPFLPPKNEYVLFLTLSDVQVKLYQHYLDNYSRRPLPGKSSGFLFPDFQSLQRIWTHPLVLKYNSERYEIMQQKKRDKEDEDSEGSLVDFIDDDSTPDESSLEDSTDDSSDMSDDSRKKRKKKKSSKKSKGKDKDKESAAASKRRTRANPVELDDEDDVKNEDLMEVKYENPTEWWIKMVTEDELDDMRHSHKLVLLFDILRQCETIGDKLLVFSQSLYSLDLIEHFLGKVDEATQEGRIDEKLGGHVGSWSPGIDYFRLDGSTSCENRSIWCKNFNKEDNPRARLFLISTRAGGLGINLVAANRVVIFDVSWNPSHDVQSIFRVYRFGQKKPCYVYRFLAMGTMEEKIYERQVTKQAISKRVIDEQQIDRHYAENDLAELYKFEAEPPLPRELPPLPKDRLFAEMLKEHEKQIYKYHEHDSMLENKEEETLSEEERKAAWEDFENEKNRPPPAPFVSPWAMHNGMVPNLMAQQQQQFAFAALAAMMRKEGANDAQIRDAVPMLYNSNPGLMQKMSELYKYSQMNMAPGMMGQAGMNPVSGAAAVMGGASGLQYEPPWQRQQQQQQQMRLQQLLAQQQNMGAAAKFYAGGLGSRDPVAMALQQQRAREIMVGGGAGRPRGRPPLQPRAPPAPLAPSAAPPDVVDLDSD